MSHAPPGAAAAAAVQVDLALTAVTNDAVANADLDHRPSTGHVRNC